MAGDRVKSPWSFLQTALPTERCRDIAWLLAKVPSLCGDYSMYHHLCSDAASVIQQLR